MIVRALYPEFDEDIWVINGMRSGLSDVIRFVSLQRLCKTQVSLNISLHLRFRIKAQRRKLQSCLLKKAT